ncbi:hypothetical protein QZH41_018284 [Actinostola sp. cb2023]|nr:hypothetical protein QZH41_018284 [Actinostola sp. cb2023]
MTIRKLQFFLKPDFSEDGTNTRKFEGEMYSVFVHYLREAASGRRGNVTLNKILQFTTGEDEEPVLGFKIPPSLVFVDADDGHFLPTANTCINRLKLPVATMTHPKSLTEVLHNLYDYAFSNSYFGLV